MTDDILHHDLDLDLDLSHRISSTGSPRAPARSRRRALISEAAHVQTPNPGPAFPPGESRDEGPHISSTSDNGI